MCEGLSERRFENVFSPQGLISTVSERLSSLFAAAILAGLNDFSRNTFGSSILVRRRRCRIVRKVSSGHAIVECCRPRAREFDYARTRPSADRPVRQSLPTCGTRSSHAQPKPFADHATRLNAFLAVDWRACFAPVPQASESYRMNAGRTQPLQMLRSRRAFIERSSVAILPRTASAAAALVPDMTALRRGTALDAELTDRNRL